MVKYLETLSLLGFKCKFKNTNQISHSPLCQLCKGHKLQITRDSNKIISTLIPAKQDAHSYSKSRAGNSLISCLSESLVFCKKMSEWAICSKKERFTHSFIFGEQPERITHGRSFLVTKMRDLLTSLIFGERPEQFPHITHQKWGNEPIAIFFFLSLYKTNKKKYLRFFFAKCFWANLPFAHLSWGTWANCSQSFICHDWPERFAHGRSFFLSYLNDSLTVAQFSWAIWANRS